MTAELKSKMVDRDKLLIKSRKSKSQNDIQTYKQKRNEVNKLVRKVKAKHYRDLLENSANDPNNFWSTLKKLFPTKQTNSPPATFNISLKNTIDPKIIANTFCKFFTNVIGNLKKQLSS